ncbi:hypothetical protein RI129_011783 [Pyrocoelia pectoralis]|uniref:Uncharacterized protein n=1 Tax=Pyrocoelia pectoralis TaxID=417401 RepID=A0AAN7ZG62_9COLE
MTLHFLANDIATYLRMAVSHLGIPNWQFIYTPNGVPQWTEVTYMLYSYKLKFVCRIYFECWHHIYYL